MDRKPIPVIEILDALKREGYYDIVNLFMEEMYDWQTRTIMCRVHEGPEETVSHER